MDSEFQCDCDIRTETNFLVYPLYDDNLRGLPLVFGSCCFDRLNTTFLEVHWRKCLLNDSMRTHNGFIAFDVGQSE